MSDRCQTHKARACQKCAGDAEVLTHTSALFVRHDDRCESEYEPGAHAWTPCGCWASRAEAEGLVAEVERLAGVVAKVRDLADQWNAGRRRQPSGGRRLLSATDVVARLYAALDQADPS